MAPSISAKDSQGFWGRPTSTIDWCEYNYEVTPYIAEFWNTITNLSMIIPPIYGIIDALKNNYEKRFILSYLALLIIGIGSWLFHMTLKYEMQLLDEIPMVFGSALLIYNLSEVRQPGKQRNNLLIAALLAHCFLFLFVYLNIHEPIFHEVMYGILVFVMLVLDVKLVIAYPTPVNNKVFAFGAGAYLLGFLLWNLDNNFCPSLRLFRSKFEAPLAPLSQLHGWWHLLAGYSTYVQILGLIYQRQRYLKKNCSYGLSWMGLVVKTTNDEKIAKKTH